MRAPLTIRLRPARGADAELLWRWVNDPATRKASFHSKTIPWKTHERWFRSRLAQPGTRIYIAEATRTGPLGQIRFDRKGPGLAEIDVSVDPGWRGKGLGRRIVLQATRRAARPLGITRVRAAVKSENAPSLATFEAAGFARLRRIHRNGCPGVLLELVVRP